jgi:multimeric flavodoxin WrbA
VGKSILVFNGSPRDGGNSDLLADAFIKGATKAGHEVVKCEVGKKNIIGCKACDACYSKGKPCSFDDDFNGIAPFMGKADAIIFITPLYWFTFPARLKAAIDKMYSLLSEERN